MAHLLSNESSCNFDAAPSPLHSVNQALDGHCSPEIHVSSARGCFAAIALSTVIAASGCATAPKVEYQRITSASQLQGDEFDAYALQKSIIHVDAEKDATGKLATPYKLTVTSAPAESNDFKIVLRHREKPGVRTNLTVTKIENTDLIKEAGTEVIDSRIDIIQKVGGILVSLVGVAFSADRGITEDAFPIRIDSLALMKDKNVNEGAESVVTPEGLTINFGPIAADAKPIDEFPDGVPSSAIYYAACRKALIKVPLKNGRYEQSVKVSDPRYFQSIGLPKKGKVTFHSQCGVSVSADSDPGVKSTVDVVGALTAQGIAIKEAIDAAKKKDK